jgi:hypothetical protein
MPKETYTLGPVVVGGVGGSGTRVVAEILMKLGLFMGEVRDPDKDNFWFTAMFFSRPGWFTDFETVNQNRVLHALNVFEDLMFSHFQTPLKMVQSRLRALLFHAFFWRSSRITGIRNILPGGLRVAFRQVPFSRFEHSNYMGWGWKEPVSHIYLEWLSEYFHGLKYIHLVREGLDMAFSDNTGQMEEWGKLFGIRVPFGEEGLARAALKYWMAANKRAVETGSRLLGDRFLLMDFEALCYAPRQGIERLATFLGLDSHTLDLDALCKIPHIPESIGRHKEKDLSIFRQKDMDAKEKAEKFMDQIRLL